MPDKKVHYSKDDMDSRTHCDRRITGLLRSSKKSEVTCRDCLRIMGRPSVIV